MATETGSESLVRALVDAGVAVCFANPGTTEMHVVSALDTVPGIRSVLGLHETVVTGAADGYGRMARKPACTLLHLGPGLANGVANLHNAKRARTPVVNLVGDMATWHIGSDAPLCSDITSLASYTSSWVRTATESTIADDARAAVAAALVPADPLGSRVATLIVPHDVSWAKLKSTAGTVPRPPTPPTRESARVDADASAAFFKDCTAALRAAPAGAAALLLGGDALLADGLRLAASIAAATGAVLFCENGFARVDRGGDLPPVRRLPYFPKDAAATLGAMRVIALVGVKLPVPMFGYADGPAALSTLGEEALWELDALPPLEAIAQLAAAAGTAAPPSQPPRGPRPPPPADRGAKLTPSLLCAVVAALQPERAIVVDEALTSGTDYWARSAESPAFSHLTLTGGAIGFGLPASVGAAIACPDRRVVLLQADGSGAYSSQALWTQAREVLDVVTVICHNDRYNILRLEQAVQRCSASGSAARSLTDLSQPPMDWVSLAKGYGLKHAVRVETVGQLVDVFKAACARAGPTLIEAMLP